MSWFQFEWVLRPTQLAEAESILFECGAISLSLVSDTDEPVLEPAPGELPLWSSIRMRALFPLSVDIQALKATLASEPSIAGGMEIQFVGERDWQAQARRFAVDRVFAGRLRLRPPTHLIEEDDPYVNLYLEPGLAFGSGAHATTAMCLTWLAAHVVPDLRVLDFGCGSGVLGIAAALLGAQVIAVDYDQQALQATRENADRNGCLSGMDILSLEAWQAAPVGDNDVVVANILAGPLVHMAQGLCEVLRPGGWIVLSGILESQVDEVTAAYAGTVKFTAPLITEEWVCLLGRS
ncbi:MAG: 50S ribosomal protein L11 methyltransferase [Pseudomonadota bacterium]|nr:50S ribosomal protein L11 methyltransferase [Pseudomonadota bacterium]